MVLYCIWQTKALIKSTENTKNSSFGPPERVRAVSNGSLASGSDKQRKRKRKEATVTYLNVHAGVSVGVMAGMDVGAQDRFEVSAQRLLLLLCSSATVTLSYANCMFVCIYSTCCWASP